MKKSKTIAAAALTGAIAELSAKEKITEFENQSHYVFTNHSSEFSRFHHSKQDAIELINKYDDHVKLTASMYIDNLLLEADTEYRRLASAYDRQLSKQMARIDADGITLKKYPQLQYDGEFKELENWYLQKKHKVAGATSEIKVLPRCNGGQSRQE